MTAVPPPRLDRTTTPGIATHHTDRHRGGPNDLVPAVAEMLGCHIEAPARFQRARQNRTGPTTRWRIESGPVWHLARPAGHVRRNQGWQLHLSATPRTVTVLLEQVVPVLRTERLAFAFAPGLAVVRWLATDACGYSDFGKVLTVWPHDDADFARLAEQLHRATSGLAGPRVLSARGYQPGSVVHYRYGCFTQSPEDSAPEDSAPDDGDLDNDGLVRGDGDTAAGALAAVAGLSVPEADTCRHSEPVRWDGRYVVRATWRHGPAVAVHLASDDRAESAATEVVLKHARAHANPEPDGTDARDRLVAEARLLHRLSRRVRTPRPLRVFAADGDVVLVEECVTGVPLRQWIRRQSATGAGLPPIAALRLARQLCTLVGAVRGEGVVLRNLNPGHLVVAPDATPALVDLSDAVDVGGRTSYRGEPGYQAPELRGTGTTPVPAEPSADLYSLGALLFLLVTGNDPVLAEDDPPGSRPDRDRLAAWLDLLGRYDETSRLLRPAIMILMAGSPSERADLDQVQDLLATDPAGVPARLPASQPTGEDLLADGLAHLVATMSADGSRLWPSGPSGARTDPRNVQHGAAGVLAVLLRAHADSAPTGTSRVALEAPIRKAASWLSLHSARGGAPLPGLYFGRSGVAWVLADAAAALDEPQLLAQAEHLAQLLPTSWPNPDVAHGLAGAALTQLHLGRLTSNAGGRRLTGTSARTGSWSGDGRFLARAAVYAEALRRAAVAGPYGPTWPIPRTFASKLAGANHYGFAHGVAGIGYALLALGAALDDSAYTTLAVEAGYTLCRAARTDDDGAAWWPVGPADPTRLPHWCSGSSGVGTFLLRLCVVAGEQRCGEFARAAAGAVHRARWASPPSACHGLAGNGQFLLDAAELLADPTYRAWAEDLVPLLAVRHCRRDGRALVPDETLRSVVADYNVGLAGVLAYLLRLRHGGSRLFHVDELLLEDAALRLSPDAATVR